MVKKLNKILGIHRIALYSQSEGEQNRGKPASPEKERKEERKESRKKETEIERKKNKIGNNIFMRV